MPWCQRRKAISVAYPAAYPVGYTLRRTLMHTEYSVAYPNAHPNAYMTQQHWCISGNFKLFLLYVCFNASDGSGKSDRCPNTSVQAGLNGRERGDQALGAILLCCFQWKDILGKSEHNHRGYPENCPLPAADNKPFDEA